MHLVYYDWTATLSPLPADANTDEVWGLFLGAVEAYDDNHPDNKVSQTLDRLAVLTTLPRKAWANRVRYYAKRIAPEIRRWYTHIKGTIPLPRI